MNNKAEILQELHETAPLLASLNKVDVYSVPNNYFDDLSGSILSKIKALQDEQIDELNEIAPTLSKIGKQNVYAVPANYFETFKVNVPAEKALAKIVNIRKVNIVIKYAVAAVVAGIIFTGSFLFKHHDNSNQIVSPVNVANAMKNISDDELSEYADDHNIQLNYDSLVDDNSDLNIAAELKGVSYEELEQYYKSQRLTVASIDN